MDKSIAVKNLAAVSRRRFVKTFALGTAFSMLAGKAWRASVLADILPTGASGLMRVKLSDYPALLEDFGSVRIGINPFDEQTAVEAYGPFYPVMINHQFGNIYYALSTYCHHAGYVVPIFREHTGCIECQHEFSKYAIDGSLITGPSTSPLDQYPITFDGVDTLTVEVPNLGYKIETALVQSGNTPRLRLDFFGFLNVEYEVYFRETITQPWTVIPFSLTQNGTADQLSIFGQFSAQYVDLNGSPASIFVNRTTQTGFYSVGIKPFPVQSSGYPDDFLNLGKG